MKRLAVIHSLARSGGTLFSKVIGCMDNLILLSEIHPKGPELIWSFYGQSRIALAMLFHPVVQAKQWHGLNLKKDEAEISFAPKDDEFLLYIEEIYDHVNQDNKFLIIRDWCHLDYVGLPFRQPTYVNHLKQILTKKFLLNEVYLIRHPIDQVTSFAKAVYRKPFSLEKYLYGYLSYIKSASADQFIKYEDFVDAPAELLCKTTQILEVPYDPEWGDKWSQNQKVTGDGRANVEAIREKKIERRPRPPVSPKVLEAFEKSPTYQEILTLTGYSHPF
ncbi:hypothetical protein [Trichothermofontia sp.]